MKIFTGKVIATKNLLTATVVVERITTHPTYMKKIRKTRKYQVHDEMGVKLGETVKFVATKPYSRLKKWRTIK